MFALQETSKFPAERRARDEGRPNERAAAADDADAAAAARDGAAALATFGAGATGTLALLAVGAAYDLHPAPLVL